LIAALTFLKYKIKVASTALTLPKKVSAVLVTTIFLTKSSAALTFLKYKIKVASTALTLPKKVSAVLVTTIFLTKSSAAFLAAK